MPPASPSERRTTTAWLVSFLGAMLALAALWSGTIRTDATPYGDGNRIMKFIELVRGPAQGYAEWDPYRNGGYPLFANAEHFWLQSLVVDPASPHANLVLNLCLFGFLMANGALAWALGRRLGLDPLWTGLLAVTVGFGEILIETEQSARFQALSSYGALLAVMWALLAPRMRAINYAVAIAAVAVALSVGTYYALVHGTLVYSFLLFRQPEAWRRPMRHILVATASALAIGVVALLLSALWSLPLIGHIRHSHIPADAVSYEPILPGSVLDFVRLLVPFVGEERQLSSLLVVPALIVWRQLGSGGGAAPLLRGILLPMAYFALFLLMALPLVGPHLAELYAAVPLISGVRRLLPFSMLALIGLTATALLLLAAHATTAIAELDRRSRSLLAGFLLLSAATTTYQAVWAREPVTGIAAFLMLAAGGYFAAGAARQWTLAAIERKSIEALTLALAGLTTLTVVTQAFWEHKPGERKEIHVDNRPLRPALEGAIIADGEPYFRVLRERTNGILTSETRKRAGPTFSYYFPTGLAYSLAYLSERHDIARLRPHWVDMAECKDLDAVALELLRVKYLFCGELETDPAELPGWEEVGSERRWMLLRRQGFEGGPHSFCRWRGVETVPPKDARGAVLAAFTGGTALVAPEAMPGMPEPSDACPPGRTATARVTLVEDRPGRMRLTVEAEHPSVIVVPDNFDHGWRATIDGKEAPVVRAYHAYIGVAVAAGRSDITLFYQDKYLRWGLATSLATALGLLIYVVAGGALARRRAGPSVASPP